MWLKVFSVIGILLQIILQLVQALSQHKLRQEGRDELASENEKIIEDRVDEANNIRAGNELSDELLLKPAERGAGGLPGLSADLRGIGERSQSVVMAAGGAENQGAQSYMGKELSPFNFTIPKRKIEKVFIHCSASDRPEDDNVKTINQWHLARGWAEIGYNYYIDKQGRIWTGRDVEKIPAAQYGHNTGSIAICLGGKSEFTAAQFLNLDEMCRIIAAKYAKVDIAITFHGHCEVSHKTCPNFDYKGMLGLDEHGRMPSVA